MTKKSLSLIVSVLILVLSVNIIYPQRQMENLDRGVVRVWQGNGNFISWRLSGTEWGYDTGFNIYRDGTKLNSSPITDSTNYFDSQGSSISTYTVSAVINGEEQEISGSSLNLDTNYLSIPIEIPSEYEANDVSVGDLDGDGEYEIVLKVYPLNAKDNSQSGYTDPTILDAYKLNGTHMWRINLGINIRSGAHYTQFIVYDLDGDGKAEVACKTADGSMDAAGNYIGDQNADYRNSNGYILSGPEYLTIFDGATGRALATTDYIPARGNVSDWGDSYGNRVDRFLACAAYIDGTRPSLIMCRGYYTRTVLAAWNWRDNQLTHVWTFDSGNGSYSGQGNHNLSCGDVDDDGRDEIVYGAICIDDNGTGLWNAGLGHGDAIHLSDIDPDRPGLEKWGIHENASIGSALLDARTGEIIWSTGAGDIGRGVAADVNPSYYGMECWGGTSGLRSCTNQSAGTSPSSSNHVVWWDDDLCRELLDSNYIAKYNGSTLLTADGCSSNNGTKSNPCLQADIFGDWREEVIWKTTDNQYLRIYTTTYQTTNKIYTLMHDPIYRMGIAWQNVGYNQPPHTGFYLGQGMNAAPLPDIYLTNTSTIPQKENIALYKTSSSSSEESGNITSYGNDSNTATRWCASSGSLPQWWQVDLGSIYDISGTQVIWEFSGKVYNYNIQVSDDNSNWTVVSDKSNNSSTAKIQDDSFTASARYVRITITGLPDSTWASLYEFKVFPDDGSSTGTYYNLTTSAGTGGTVEPSGSNDYQEGDQVQITAVPLSGYKFDGWSGDASGSDNPLTVYMNSDKSITANFNETQTGEDEGSSASNPLLLNDPQVEHVLDLSNGYIWVSFPRSIYGSQINHNGNQFDVSVEDSSGNVLLTTGLTWAHQGPSDQVLIKIVKNSGYDSIKLIWW